MPRIESYGHTDIGLKRKHNEDTFAVDTIPAYCLVADGMGGAAAGEIASRLFAETVREIFKGTVDRSDTETLGYIQKAFSLSNAKILNHIQSHPSHAGMGCTAELLAFCRDGFVLGHIGDSRTYRLRNGSLKQLTKDHSLVQEQLDQGLITPDEAKRHANRNVILRAVGTGSQLALDIVRGKVYPGDLFLLCSDGLTDMVDDTPLLHAINSDGPLEETADQLVSLALAAGGSDNITVVLARVL